jgi:hypothetical protein
VTASTGFGRRQPLPPPLVRPPSPQPFDLSPEAEAFRAQLAEAPGAASGFEAWRSSQRGRQALVWGLSLFFLSPGLFCFLVNAPAGVSGGLEVVGLFAGFWLRRERRRRLSQIVAWDEPA